MNRLYFIMDGKARQAGVHKRLSSTQVSLADIPTYYVCVHENSAATPAVGPNEMTEWWAPYRSEKVGSNPLKGFSMEQKLRTWGVNHATLQSGDVLQMKEQWWVFNADERETPWRGIA